MIINKITLKVNLPLDGMSIEIPLEMIYFYHDLTYLSYISVLHEGD